MELRDFIGVPFLSKGRTLSGLDCWGLVWMVEREIYGRNLPSFDTIYNSAHESWFVEQKMLSRRGMFIEYPLGSEKEGDILLLQDHGRLSHVGVVIDPTGKKMLHTRSATGAIIERYDSLRWKDRIAGVYRCG